MTNNSSSHPVTGFSVRLIDDPYLAWLTADESDQSLRAWFAAAPGDVEAAYGPYQAALQREEAAARNLQRLHEVVEPRHDELRRPAQDASA